MRKSEKVKEVERMAKEGGIKTRLDQNLVYGCVAPYLCFSPTLCANIYRVLHVFLFLLSDDGKNMK